MSLHLDPNILGSKINRNDLHATTTGKGHDFTNGYNFPPSLLRRTLPDVLPPVKNNRDRITWSDEILKAYETTTGTFHNRKSFGVKPFKNPCYKKAAAHWNVHYMKDVYEKLQATDSKRVPLTMGYQTSETKAEFTAKNSAIASIPERSDYQPFNLRQHHISGPSSKVITSNKNPAVAGDPYYVPEKGTFKLNDIYLTTNNKEHRRFTRKELMDYPKKDIATYWQCENYPKAWGHGLKTNPLTSGLDLSNQSLMRDEVVFKSPTNIPNLPKLKPNVPHKGMKTLMSDSYKGGNGEMNKYNLFCPIDTPYVATVSGAKEIMTIPFMYKTEYGTYGSGRPVTVA